jgi:hypothetical protein
MESVTSLVLNHGNACFVKKLARTYKHYTANANDYKTDVPQCNAIPYQIAATM